MTLSKYTDNLYQSEVYRELERHAVKKGFFKPTDTELVKLAAQEISNTEKINQSIDETPSDDLIQDVARLAYAMRRKGFITQAEDIEQKLVMYKVAESALYNVTEETNADLIGFAHRDGDVNILPGSGDLGTFETTQSIADKILAVTRKQPTGINRMAALADMITKNAQAQGGNIPKPSGGATGTWEDSENVNVIKENPKTRKLIISNIETTLQEFDSFRKNTPSIDNFYFNDLKNPNQQVSYIYFAKLAGIQVNPRQISAWYNVANVAKQEGVLTEGNLPTINAEALYNKLNNAIPAWMRLHPVTSLIPAQTNSLRNIANALGVLDTFDSKYLNENNKSTYIFAGGLEVATNNTNSMAACNWLSQQANSVYISAFGDRNDTIIKAQMVLKSFPENLYKELNGIKIDNKINDVNSALMQLIRISRSIGDSLGKFKKDPTFTNMKKVNEELINQIVNWASGLKESIDVQYKSIAPSEQMQLFTMDTSQLDSAFEYWYNKSQSEDINVAKKGKLVSNKIKQLQEVIEEYTGRPWVELQDALSDMGIDAPNKNIFLASVRQIANSANRRL